MEIVNDSSPFFRKACKVTLIQRAAESELENSGTESFKLHYAPGFTNCRHMKKILLVSGILAGQFLFAQEKPLLSVYFPKDGYQLSGQQKGRLDSLADAWKRTGRTAHISVAGFCDPDGANEYNDQLSLRRAKTVQEYLLQSGIAAVNVSEPEGFGERKPVNSNKDENDKQQNRRVDIFLSRPTIPVKTIREQIEDTTIQTGSSITIQNINFEPGMHKFLPSADPMLIQLLDAMRKNPFLEIEVQGHICCIPDKGDGIDLQTGESDLSVNRAVAIVNFLKANGIDPERIRARGFGHSKPLYPYPERNEEERVANRRVEILIINK